MLGTVILDSFKEAEAVGIAEALDMLCSPEDNYGWASTGVYSFFDVDTKETLYLGLAQDFTQRFKQHTGLSPCDPRFCKKEKIAAHFQQKEKIGFGIFAQSPLSQPTVLRNKKERGNLFDDDLAGLNYAQTAEGLLIQAHKLTHGKLPPWNVIGGAARGQRAASEEDITIVQALSGHVNYFIVARSTLRELARDPLITKYEEDIHAARILSALERDALGALSTMFRMSYKKAVPQEYIDYLQRCPQL